MISKLCGYVMTLVAAGMLVAMSQSMLTLGRMKKIAALAGGTVLVLTALTPLVNLELGDLSWDGLDVDTTLIDQMQEDTINQRNRIIKEKTETYILDKAKELGAAISADVTVAMAEAGYGYPYSVRVTGVLSASQKEALSSYMAEELGIPKQRQVWRTV